MCPNSFPESVFEEMRSRYIVRGNGRMSTDIVLKRSRGLIPLRRGTCKACIHPEQNGYLQAVYDGKMSNADAAKGLGINLQTWYGHLKYCVKNAVESAIEPEIEGIAKRVVDHVDKLIGQVDRVENMVLKINESLKNQDPEKIDPKKMASWLAAENQLKSTLEMLAKISGDLNNSAIVNISNVKMEFTDFQEKVMEIMCPNCRAKLADIDTMSTSEIKNENIITVEKDDS